jgi:hypothetical protein
MKRARKRPAASMIEQAVALRDVLRGVRQGRITSARDLYDEAALKLRERCPISAKHYESRVNKRLLMTYGVWIPLLIRCQPSSILRNCKRRNTILAWRTRLRFPRARRPANPFATPRRSLLPSSLRLQACGFKPAGGRLHRQQQPARRFEIVDHVVEKPRRGRAVHEPMVVGQTERHHQSNGHRIVRPNDGQLAGAADE